MIFAHLIQAASSLPTDASALESFISALERAISALESDIATLDSSSAPWEHRLPLFSVIVALGVVMELWVIGHEYRDDMETWALTFFGVLRRPARPSAFKVGVEVASVLLITVGIVGELWVGIQIASINGALRGKSAELRSKNAELRTASDQLVALITSEAEEAKRLAATADLARVRLEASVEWRRLSEKQKEAFADKLKRYVWQRAEIRYNSGDSEAASFAASIADVLRTRAHWHVPPLQPLPQILFSASGSSTTTGVGVQSGVVGDSSNEASKTQSELLIKLLNDAGFDADASFTWKVMPGATSEERQTIAIAVKHRPEGPQGQYKLQAQRRAKATKKQAQSNHAAN